MCSIEFVPMVDWCLMSIQMSSEWREKERERERVGSKNKKERIHGSTKYVSRVDKEKKEVYI